MIFTSVILPILFVVLLGFLLRRLSRLDEHAFSRLQLYVLSPALVFYSMAGSEVILSLVLKILLFIVIVSMVILAVVQGAGWLFKSGKAERNAMSLAAVMTNSGFYGVPVCLLAFGEQGMIYATMYLVGSSIFQSTVGIYIASAGTRKGGAALATIFKVPLIHALVISRVLVHFEALPPEPFMKMITLLGSSAIPIGLLLLGMQLEKTVFPPLRREAGAAGETGETGKAREKGEEEGLPAGEIEEKGDRENRRNILGGLAAGILRIAGGFALALVLVRFFDLDPLLEKVIIVQSSMPTAVNAVVYATEFNCRPRLVTVGILTGTLGSVISLTLILAWLVG
ncbi:MAG: AEC family transporter [Candidatus Krumholzibacteriota bacterium]|nr:AEC family transporter [Candidatus Krumholzibacteriota bacterium]